MEKAEKTNVVDRPLTVGFNRFTIPVIGGIFFLLIGLWGCREDRKISWSIYHWKTNYQPTSAEKEFLKTTSVDRLYVRYFDVVKRSGALQPEAQLTLQDSLDVSMEIVPCIYITNSSLKQIRPEELVLLAERMVNKVTIINQQLNIHPTELLLDCDWTPTTQSAYFQLVEAIKERSNYSLVSTVRLHQLKHFERTGVPPVSRGQLMLYNMGALQNIEEQNSILNLTAAQHYQRHLNDYPIRLDISIPLFSWVVLFRRGKSIELISDYEEQLFMDTTLFDKKRAGLYRLKRDTFIFGQYRYQHDFFRLEKSENKDLLKLMKQWEPYLPNEELEIALYDMRARNLKDRANALESMEAILR